MVTNDLLYESKILLHPTYRATEAAKRLGVTSRFAHLDTTSFHVDGRYNRAEEPYMSAAVTRPTRRFVPIQAVDQQDIPALHRVCERLMGARTALVNAVHGLLTAYGIVVPKGVSKFRQTVVSKRESEQDKLTPLRQEMFWKLVEEFIALRPSAAARLGSMPS